jgi:glycosyltransferase involved in cell wall biosynthesis
MSTAPPIQRVVYVVSLFPCWSETFIVREIRTLIADGVDVRIVSLKPPSETLVQADAHALRDRVHHPDRSLAGAFATLAEVVRHPLEVLACIGAIVADMWRTPTIALKSLVALARGLQHLRWLRTFDPQLIHAHWATYPSTVAWALARIDRRRFSFTCHAHDIFLDHQLLARKLNDAALAVTISRFNIDWLSRHVGAHARQRLAVVHCGVDLQRSVFQLDGRDSRRIVAVGRLDPIKGFDVLVDALGLLNERGIDFRCSVIGEGPLRTALEAQTRERGLGERIEWVGALPQEAVQAALLDAAIFALPCQVAADGNRDGIPVALMEAMASGCTVATTAVSGIPELVADGIDGVVVVESDPVALADALQHLLQDAALRRRLALAARQRVEREFDAQSEARKLRQLMSEAVHER